MRRKRNILLAILLLLILVLGGLVYVLLGFREAEEPEVFDVSPGLTHIRSIYAFGPGADGLLRAPWGIAFVDGELFVGDNQLGAVYVFSEDGEFLRKIGARATGEDADSGGLVQPLGVGVDGVGDIMVADSAGKVDFYDRQGAYRESLTVESPVIPFYADGRIYVTTAGPLLLFDQESLQPLTSWGVRGRGDDDFDFPNGIARGEDGTVYVADSNNMRVKAVDANGVQLWSIGQPPVSMDDTDRVFGLPGGLALVDDTLYVVDPLNNVIHLISTAGEYLGATGETDASGEYFSYPTQIVYMGDKRFAVTEWGNARVEIIEIDRDAVLRGE